MHRLAYVAKIWRNQYQSASPRLLRQAWGLVLFCTLWLTVLMPVFPQESYYWLYGKHPALSYLDHPPMVGWLLTLSTSFLGDGAIGLRAPTALSALGVTWIGMDLMRRMGGSIRAQTLWVLLSIAAPAFAMTHFLMLPDGPLVFFWTATIYALWRARETSSLTWWVAAGAAAGGTLLSKYSAAFLLPGGLLILIFDPVMRRQLRRPGPWIALILASLCFVPVMIWNEQHDWISFSFQTASRYKRAHIRAHWLLQFVAGQLVLLLPLLIIAWAGVPWMLARLKARSAKALWLASFFLPLFGFMLVNSVAMHVKINWVLPAYVTLGLAVCLWLDRCRIDRSRPRLFRAMIVLSLVLAASAILAPLIDIVPQTGNINWTGWPRIAQRAEHWEEVLDRENGVEGDIFFFCENDRDSSQLARNLFLHVPEWSRTEIVSAQNVFGLDGIEFNEWSNVEHAAGDDAIFVLTNPDKRKYAVEQVRHLFREVRRAERLEIHRLGRTVLTADIYTCKGYTGP